MLRLLTNLNNDPLGSGRRICESAKEVVRLPYCLERQANKQTHLPSEPLWLRCQRVEADIGITHKTRMSGSFCNSHTRVRKPRAWASHAHVQASCPLTLVSNEVDLGTALHNAKSMILHAGAAPNVTKDEDLVMVILGILRRLVPLWENGDEVLGEGDKDEGGYNASHKGEEEGKGIRHGQRQGSFIKILGVACIAVAATGCGLMPNLTFCFVVLCCGRRFVVIELDMKLKWELESFSHLSESQNPISRDGLESRLASNRNNETTERQKEYGCGCV